MGSCADFSSQTLITTVNWSTFRSPNHFIEPESFIPERWLPNTHPLYDLRFQNDNLDVVKPFAFGPRECIGKHLAYTEMRLVITTPLWVRL